LIIIQEDVIAVTGLAVEMAINILKEVVVF
jgi:hypothetical protein